MQKLNIEVIFYKSKAIGGFSEHLNSILNQLNELPKDKIPVKLTFFTTSTNLVDFDFEYNLITQNAVKYRLISPIALISQPPAQINGLALEVVIFEDRNRKYELVHSNSSLLLRCMDIEILFCSVNSYQDKTFQDNVQTAFQQLNLIMTEYNFNYSNVIRQWNYIEDILCLTDENGIVRQNYQTFNNCRTFHYSTANFINGYPVATGIGTNCGGCCVEIIALKGVGTDLVTLHNNRQIDAHCYSGNVLVGNHEFEYKPATTPKFERAKIVKNSTINMLLISGTASIIGEKTVCKGDVAGQTQITIDNIKILLDSALTKLGCEHFKLLNYRVYLKNLSDIEKVKQICDSNFDPKVGIILISDICRDDLLVEIECNYILNN